jgi:hypothetical protein
MKNNMILAFCCALVCSALQSVVGVSACASDVVNSWTNDAFTDNRHTLPPYEAVQVLRSNCRRYGVVWSGGIALRFSDRISPRPIRSRWDSDSDNRILCTDVDWSKQYRLSDQPMIR